MSWSRDHNMNLHCLESLKLLMRDLCYFKVVIRKFQSHNFTLKSTIRKSLNSRLGVFHEVVIQQKNILDTERMYLWHISNRLTILSNKITRVTNPRTQWLRFLSHSLKSSLLRNPKVYYSFRKAMKLDSFIKKTKCTVLLISHFLKINGKIPLHRCLYLSSGLSNIFFATKFYRTFSAFSKC